MSEICPYYFMGGSRKTQLKTDLREVIDIGEKIEILTNYGNKQYYTITSLLDANKMHLCGRRENGQNRGLEFAIDSSLFEEYDIGWKKIESFPENVTEIAAI